MRTARNRALRIEFCSVLYSLHSCACNSLSCSGFLRVWNLLLFHSNDGSSCHTLYVQVFDLEKHRPDKVLKQLWANFEELGSTDAEHLRSNLRILTAGGDGTVAWVLQVRVLPHLWVHHPCLELGPCTTTRMCVIVDPGICSRILHPTRRTALPRCCWSLVVPLIDCRCLQTT